MKRAEEKAGDLRSELTALERSLEDEVDALAGQFDPAALVLEEVRVQPKKSDIQVEQVILAWMPWIVKRDGAAAPAF